MSNPRLSILIATMPSRFSQYMALLDCLEKQYQGVEVEIAWDNSMDINIGQKRNKLLSIAQGDYICFIDDDDHISDRYISLILKAIESNPDCVGIEGWMTTNGTDRKEWKISKDYHTWHQVGNCYYRTPNHISPIKRELALQVMFPEIEHGEDYAFSMNVLPLLKTEYRIFEQIYHYDYHIK